MVRPAFATVLIVTLLGATVQAAEPLRTLNPIPDRPPAPDFTLTALDGRPHRLSDYRGKVVVLNFWATWCAPCLQEMPLLQRLWEQTRARGVQVLAVNWMEDDLKTVAAFRERLAVDFPILLDADNQLGKTWPIQGLPTTLVIDGDGRQAFRVLGELQWDDPGVLETILSLRRPE